ADARDLALQGQIAELVAAEAELAVVAARPTGEHAAVADSRRVAVARERGELGTRRLALLGGLGRVEGDRLQRLALLGVLRHELAPLLVAGEDGLLGHVGLRPGALQCPGEGAEKVTAGGAGSTVEMTGAPSLCARDKKAGRRLAPAGLHSMMRAASGSAGGRFSGVPGGDMVRRLL